jgi:hypothetical protein
MEATQSTGSETFEIHLMTLSLETLPVVEPDFEVSVGFDTRNVPSALS